MKNEEMSMQTKKALAAALKSAMEKKPLSKVTVSELITACNINRKTFYYHFEDVYALLKWMLEQEAIDVVKKFDLVVNAEEAIRFVMDYVDENKHIINCAYDSMGHTEIKRFFFTDMFGVIRNMIDSAENMLGLTVDESFKNYLSCFYTEATAGMLVDWIKNNAPQDTEGMISDILLIFREAIPNILRAKAEEKKLYEKN